VLDALAGPRVPGRESRSITMVFAIIGFVIGAVVGQVTKWKVGSTERLTGGFFVTQRYF
jgi:hypothetical protein